MTLFKTPGLDRNSGLLPSPTVREPEYPSITTLVLENVALRERAEKAEKDRNVLAQEVENLWCHQSGVTPTFVEPGSITEDRIVERVAMAHLPPPTLDDPQATLDLQIAARQIEELEAKNLTLMRWAANRGHEGECPWSHWEWVPPKKPCICGLGDILDGTARTIVRTKKAE